MNAPAMAKLTYLLQNHVVQFNGYACSAASLAMVINAILLIRGDQIDAAPITQQELLNHVAVGFWKDQLSHKGHLGRHGVSLDDLKTVCEDALKVYGISYESVDLFRIDETTTGLNDKKQFVHHQLVQMATSEHEYILAYFTQGEIVGEWFGSHVSPIGTYDSQRQTVLVLDVDPEVDGPYHAPFEQFFAGLVGKRNIYHRRGGGWVRVRVTPQKR